MSVTFSVLMVLGCVADGAAPSDTLDTDTASDTDTDTDVSPPWDEAGFWTDPGPLAALLGADKDAEERTWYVRMATSPDGVSWTERGGVIVGDFNSLDLFITDDGVILLGLVENASIFLDVATVYAVASADLETWSTHAWPVTRVDAMNLVDPSMHVRPDGRLGLVYYSASEFGVDPATIPGDHEVRRAVWGATGWQEEPDPVFALEGLVDPVICALDGTEWLLATRASLEVIAARAEPDGTFTQRDAYSWDQHSVPYCAAGDGSVTVYAQQRGVEDLPSVARFDEDQFEDLGFLFPEHLWGTNNCSSPVVGRFRDEYLLFCSINTFVERYDAPQP